MTNEERNRLFGFDAPCPNDIPEDEMRVKPVFPKCTTCKGSGKVFWSDPSKEEPCPDCMGSGLEIPDV
jgi:hypothetical protein